MNINHKNIYHLQLKIYTKNEFKTFRYHYLQHYAKKCIVLKTANGRTACHFLFNI